MTFNHLQPYVAEDGRFVLEMVTNNISRITREVAPSVTLDPNDFNAFMERLRAETDMDRTFVHFDGTSFHFWAISETVKFYDNHAGVYHKAFVYDVWHSMTLAEIAEEVLA